PAAVLVRAVRGLEADVRLRNLTVGGTPVPAGSLSRVAALGAEQGHVVEVSSSGPDAATAVERLLELATNGFGDAEQIPAPPPVSPPAGGGPLPASPGVAVGLAFPRAAAQLPPPTAGNEDDEDEDDAGDPGREEALLRAALVDTEKEIRATRDRTAAVAGEREAAVFDAHLLLLEDPDLLDRAHAAIAAGRGRVGAWRTAVAAVAEAFDRLPDPYLRARADDVRAVGDQVERHMR